jgi:hypothetical protein
MKTVQDGTQGIRHDAMLGERSASRSEAMKFGHSSALYAQSGQRIRLPSPGGRLENSPRFQAWDCGRVISRPEGTAESLLHQWEQEQTHDVRGTRPSLRDFYNKESGPGSELPGYSQISLREIGIAGPTRPNSSSSRSEVVKVAVGFSPRTGRSEDRRRGATRETCFPYDQALLSDARPTAALLLRSTVAAIRTRAVRSTVPAGGCGSACGC